MYTIALVDDNPYMLEELKSCVDWESLNIRVASACTNGFEAKRSVRAAPPDFLLTDIIMPGMTGIELAQVLLAEFPALKIVFMSSFSEFEFAKSAIDLGIAGYIMKPIKPEAIEDAMNRLVEEAEAARREALRHEWLQDQLENMLPTAREQFFRETLLRPVEDAEARKHMAFLRLDCPARYRSFALFIQFPREPEEPVQESYIEALQLKAIIRETAEPDQILQAVQMTEREFAVVLLEPEPQADAGDARAVTLGARLSLDIARRLSKSPIIGVSEGADDMARLPKLHQHARDAVASVFDASKNPVVYYGNVKGGGVATEIGLDQVYSDIRELLLYGDEEDVHTLLKERFSDGNSARTQVKTTAYVILIAALMLVRENGDDATRLPHSESEAIAKLARIETLPEIMRWLGGLLYGLQELLGSKGKAKAGHRYSQQVESIIAIVESRYAEQISVSAITRAAYLSQSYASRRFLRETGVSIFDWLQRFRMEKAKALLRDLSFSVADVAALVGYISATHFSLLFRRHVGVSPTQYRSGGTGS